MSPPHAQRDRLQTFAAMAFVAMTVAFGTWAIGGLGLLPGLLLTAPLGLCAGFVFRRSVRPLVAGGALALPYLSVAMVEIIATSGRALAPIAALAFGVVFVALLAPVTRNAKLAAVAAHAQSQRTSAGQSS